MWYSNMGGVRQTRRSSGRRSSKIDPVGGGVGSGDCGTLLAQMLYFACSRQREYLVDAGGAVFTRYPEGLASVRSDRGNPGDKEKVSKATASMYINPLKPGNVLFPHLPVPIHPSRNGAYPAQHGGGASDADHAAAWNKVTDRA